MVNEGNNWEITGINWIFNFLKKIEKIEKEYGISLFIYCHFFCGGGGGMTGINGK